MPALLGNRISSNFIMVEPTYHSKHQKPTVFMTAIWNRKLLAFVCFASMKFSTCCTCVSSLHKWTDKQQQVHRCGCFSLLSQPGGQRMEVGNVVCFQKPLGTYNFKSHSRTQPTPLSASFASRCDTSLIHTIVKNLHNQRGLISVWWARVFSGRKRH